MRPAYRHNYPYRQWSLSACAPTVDGAERSAYSPLFGGTASCLAELGYALPPGMYDVRAAIDQYDRPPQGDMIVRYLLTAPVPLTVTP